MNIKKIWDKLSIVSIQKTSNHEIDWVDIDKQIYNEDSYKIIKIKLLGLTLWCYKASMKANHNVDNVLNKPTGFKLPNVKKDQQTGSADKTVS